jgi:predicted nuclease of predicted toxin-antitoxin system
MRILLDECVPRRLTHELGDHEVRTVTEMGWAGMKNGALLQLAAESFDVLLTTDRNLAFQQNTATLPLGVIVLRAPSNDTTCYTR